MEFEEVGSGSAGWTLQICQEGQGGAFVCFLIFYCIASMGGFLLFSIGQRCLSFSAHFVLHNSIDGGGSSIHTLRRIYEIQNHHVLGIVFQCSFVAN